MAAEAFVALAVLLVLEIAQAFLGDAKVRKLQRQRAAVEHEVADLMRQAARLSSPATFTQSTKLERKAIARQKEADGLRAQQESLAHSWGLRVGRAAKTAVALLLLVWLWGRPAALVPPDFLWPVSSWMAAPHAARFGGLGVITALPWIALCRRASTAIAAAVVPQ